MARKSLAEVRKMEVLLLGTLLKHGPVESKSGAALTELWNLLPKDNNPWVSPHPMANHMNRKLIDFIKKETKGRSIYKIELASIPPEFEADLEAFLADDVEQAVEMPVEAPVEEPVEVVEEVPAPMPLAAKGPSADEVANSLLKQMLEIIAKPQAYEVDKHRLHQAEEQRAAAIRRAEDYRSDLEVAEKRIRTQQDRINNLQSELRSVQENLKVALRTSKFAIDDEVQRQVQKLMRPTYGKEAGVRP